MRINYMDILFWIFLILSTGLLIWAIFGNSPTEFFITLTILFAILIKTWSISDRQIKLEMKFNMLARNFKQNTK